MNEVALSEVHYCEGVRLPPLVPGGYALIENLDLIGTKHDDSELVGGVSFTPFPLSGQIAEELDPRSKLIPLRVQMWGLCEELRYVQLGLSSSRMTAPVECWGGWGLQNTTHNSWTSALGRQ